MQEFEFQKKIMGTDLSVSIVTEHQHTADQCFEATWKNLQAYEKQFSRFDPQSELSQLNQKRTLRVTSLFLEILQLGISLSKKTRGYFNPLFQIERFGYTATFDKIKGTAQKSQQGTYNICIDDIEVDTENRTVTLIEDQKLDFGGFLKGHLAEIEARRIQDSHPTIQGVIVNIGGDIHARGVDAVNEPFIFEIANPVTLETIAIPLLDRSIATSGTYKRTWISDGDTIHHILDQNGQHNPTTPIVSASVIHEHGAPSDAYTKILMALTIDEVEKTVGEHVRGFTITQSGLVHTYI